MCDGLHVKYTVLALHNDFTSHIISLRRLVGIDYPLLSSVANDPIKVSHFIYFLKFMFHASNDLKGITTGTAGERMKEKKRKKKQTHVLLTGISGKPPQRA